MVPDCQPRSDKKITWADNFSNIINILQWLGWQLIPLHWKNKILPILCRLCSADPTTAYQHMSHDHSNGQKLLKEITLGPCIVFSGIHEELGCSIFSNVKLEIYASTMIDNFAAYIYGLVQDCGIQSNRSISQIPQCLRKISHNATLSNRNVCMCHFCYKVVHCGIWDWCIVGYVRQVYWNPYWSEVPQNLIYPWHQFWLTNP